MKLALLFALTSSSTAFSPSSGPKSSKPATSNKASTLPSDQVDTKRPRFDPLGLYSKNTQERKDGRIEPLEAATETYGTVTDPLNLYTDKSEVDETVQMSASLPFLKQPEMLDGSLPGDRGFDPFNFASDESSLQWYRMAEIKHARLAMLAAVGWPLAELFNKPIANMLHMQPLLVDNDRVPSVLNGGLSHISPFYWMTALGAATFVEGLGMLQEKQAAKRGEDYTPGDLEFDPLGLAGKTEEEKKFKLEAELFNGRLAMLAITGFAAQEWLSQASVVNQFPIFFKPINVALEQLADASAQLS